MDEGFPIAREAVDKKTYVFFRKQLNVLQKTRTSFFEKMKKGRFRFPDEEKKQTDGIGEFSF